MQLSFEEKLQRYADLIVSIGANVQPGQNVMLRAPIDGANLARLVVESAYRAGARFVDVLWEDDAITQQTYYHAADDVFDDIPAWQKEALNTAARRGDAIIGIRSSDPQLLAKADADRVSRAQRARSQALQPHMDAVTGSQVNWCLVTIPIEGWAGRVYPDEAPARQMQLLWDAVFKAVRADQKDPVADWQQHLEALEARRQYLTDKAYRALHYRAPGTDLTLGLPEGHLWLGGVQPTQSGIVYVANMPTEEVFTLPHREQADGVVHSSMPLSYTGRLIEDFSLTFKDGQVTEATARRGEDSLHKLLEADEGSRRLGEVALVPHSSPISQMKTLFYNTLYDENAASHLALGRAYSFTLHGGTDMSDEEARAAGVNDSLEHVDFMVGSAEMDIDGITGSGQREAIMRGGEWVF